MAKIRLNDELNSLNKQLQIDISSYLSYLSESSKANYLSKAIRIIKQFRISDLNCITYEMYSIVMNSTSTKKKDFYSELFFQWVYCFKELNNASGFKWDKETLLTTFYDKKTKIEQSSIPKTKFKDSVILSIEDLQKINEYVNLDCDEISFLQSSFAWDLLFNTDYLNDNAIEDIKRIDASTYNGISIIVNDVDVIVKDKYKPLFEKLKNHSFNRGMIIYTALSNLCDNIGIKTSIKPKDIKKIRKAYMFTCPNCNLQYPNNTENWISVNNVIVCKDCAERLKKNKTFRIEYISNDEIDYLSDKEKEDIETKFSSFEQLRAKIGNEKDYIQLQKFKDKLGKLGEAYVYDCEVEYLKDTPYAEKVDKTIAYNHSNGYDILSYTKQGEEIHIEVKCTVNKEDCFYLTSHEKSIMEESFKQNTKYMIYWVKNILSENKESIKLIKYGEKEIKEYLKLEPHTYKAKDNR